MIHIGRAGTKLGSFSEFEVRQGLAAGRFFPTDLGWKEGMENWAPLSEFSEFNAPPPPMPPLPGEALPEEAGMAADQPAGLPWDNRREIGYLAAFAETARLILFNPSLAFSRMQVTGILANPLLYNLVGGWFGLIVNGIYLVLTSNMQTPPANLTPLQALFYLTPAKAMIELKIFIFLGPILVTVIALLSSAIAHLCLMLVGGAHKPFHVTLRVFCFSYGSTQLLQVLPLCGSLMAPVWMTVCCMVGLATAHGTTTGRSLAAMALFLAAGFLCCVGTFMLVLGANYDALRPMLNQ
jgi:hypothetical protein